MTIIIIEKCLCKRVKEEDGGEDSEKMEGEGMANRTQDTLVINHFSADRHRPFVFHHILLKNAKIIRFTDSSKNKMRFTLSLQ